jgi:UDP-N-acetyl-D-mannosaminuronic acid dehydrogenase
VKLAENAFRDVNIAFANELAGICEALGVAPGAAIALANRHPRVSILAPGIGVGGHCIPVDPLFLAEAVPGATGLIRTARAINDRRPEEVAARLRGALAGLASPCLGLFGLAYKPDVADLRNSPALAVAEELARDGAIRLLVCDPHLRTLPETLCRPWVELVDAPTALSRADRAAMLVAHAAFAWLDAEPGEILPLAAMARKQPAHLA